MNHRYIHHLFVMHSTDIYLCSSYVLEMMNHRYIHHLVVMHSTDVYLCSSYVLEMIYTSVLIICARDDESQIYSSSVRDA